MTTTERLRECFERHDLAGLTELYLDDAILELHVGAAHRVYRGSPAILTRYAQDYAAPATFVRWDVRDAPWGAVVEAAAVQGDDGRAVLFRWVHLLAVEDGRIARDTVYCTGAVPVAAAGGVPSPGDGRLRVPVSRRPGPAERDADPRG